MKTQKTHTSILTGFVLTLTLLVAATFGAAQTAPTLNSHRTACGAQVLPPCTAPIGIAQGAHSPVQAQVQFHLS